MKIEVLSNKAVLKPDGDLTIFEASDFHQALVELSQHSEALELDLSASGEVDSSAIQLMLAAQRDCSVAITGMTPAVLEKIDRMGCRDRFQSDVPDALSEVNSDLASE